MTRTAMMQAGSPPQQHIDAEQGRDVAHLGLAAEPEIRGDAQPLLAQGEQQDEQDGSGGGEALPHEAKQPQSTLPSTTFSSLNCSAS